jgi:hypothetical protein
MSDVLGTEDSSGERLMAEYLDRRGFTYEREPDIGGRCPDFVFDTAGRRVAVEVYEPEMRVPGGFGPIDTMEPIRAAFENRKYDQAKKVRAAGLPFLVVVGSDNADLPYNLESVLGAMFGILVSRSRSTARSKTPDPSASAERRHSRNATEP